MEGEVKGKKGKRGREGKKRPALIKVKRRERKKAVGGE